MASWQSKFTDRLIRMSWDRHVPPGLNPNSLRHRQARLMRHFGRVPESVSVTPCNADGVPAEWLEPASAQFHRVILYLHGGGYVIGDLSTHRSLAARIAEAASARVLFVDYRLAPEHPFPAALEDALTAYRWLLLDGMDPGGIAFAGDCAGGGLALAMALTLRDKRAPMPAAIAGLSPWLDMALSGRTILQNAPTDSLMSIELLAYYAQHYLAGVNPTNPMASPLYGNLAGLPPTLLHAGAKEILRDDVTRFGDKAYKAGCDISVEVFGELGHVFQQFERLPESEASIARIGTFIKSRTVAVPLCVAAQ